ncbi:MAG: ACP S-malonyltransferase [Rothia sp. (in: high G+C Gram-positive bacteria)]|nr:ACP S-malonyltransferase [Rothia sp. (in: high G+C Gram-positive bacteria)]
MIAVLSPGQGSQKPGFLTPWLQLEGVKEQLEALSEAADLDLIHYGTQADEETIKDTAVAQPLIVAAGLVTGRLTQKALEGQEIIYAGHSVGEITASALAGVLTDQEAMHFIKVRAGAMAQAAAQEPSGMAAVLGGVEQQVRQAIEAAGLTAANSNGAGQIVAAGSLSSLEALVATPPARSRVIPLKVAGAFHSPYMASAQEPLAQFAAGLSPRDPQATLLSNYDGQPVASGQQALDSLVAQVTRPVRWDLCMETLQAQQVSHLLELAPAGTLLGLAKRALKGIPTQAINSPEDLAALTFES